MDFWKKMCGCVLRRTCGLPCAHELGEMVIHGKSHIPLSSIHSRWRKLDLLDMELPNGSVDITPELFALRKRFEKLSEQQKLLMIRKLRELADPKTTLLQPLPDIQRRPSKKTDPGLQYLKGIPELPHKWSPELIELDPRICYFIEMYQDVKGDGHCGYRSIAVLRGYEEKGGWERVRNELRQELVEHDLEYTIVFGANRVQFLKHNLECKKYETMDRADWFDLPDMGHLATNTYNCVFVCIAKENVTYLPWRTTPTSMDYDIMTVGHIWKGFHFVPLTLQKNAPLPPVAPGWEKISTPIAAPWLFVIAGQL